MRLWPVLLFNCVVYALVAADHLVQSITTRNRKRAAAAANKDTKLPKIVSLFPSLSQSETGSVFSSHMFHFSLFAVALLLTMRVGRCFERWWSARKAISSLGALALGLAHRSFVWFDAPAGLLSCRCCCLKGDDDGVGGGGGGGENGGADDDGVDGGRGGSGKNGGADDDAKETTTTTTTKCRCCRRQRRLHLLAEDVARWAAIYQMSVIQVCSDSKTIHPAARKLLKADELRLYEQNSKGRQTVLHRLTQLLLFEGPAALVDAFDGFDDDETNEQGKKIKVFRDVALAQLDPKVVNELLRSGAVASGACTVIKFQSLPIAISQISIGVTEAFLALYPLASLTVGNLKGMKKVGRKEGERGRGKKEKKRGDKRERSKREARRREKEGEEKKKKRDGKRFDVFRFIFFNSHFFVPVDCLVCAIATCARPQSVLSHLESLQYLSLTRDSFSLFLNFNINNNNINNNRRPLRRQRQLGRVDSRDQIPALSLRQSSDARHL